MKLVDTYRSWWIPGILLLSVAFGPFVPGIRAQVPANLNPGNHAIFPAKGQSQDQQLKDQLAAYQWATQQTGWDPAKAINQTSSQVNAAASKSAQSHGGMLRGAARGALVGVAVGAIADDAGKGAAIGATVGGLTGGMRSRRHRREAQTAGTQAVSAYQRQFAQWDKFYVAALEGKGYTVK